MVPARITAAVVTVVGSLSTRAAWILAGRAGVRTAAMLLLCLLAATLPLSAQHPPDTSAKAVAAAAARYVAGYEQTLTFLLADEQYSQQVLDPAGRTTASRDMTGEWFVTFAGGEDRSWISVHDIREVDGEPVPHHEDLRALLARGTVAGTAARLAARNAQFNIGSVERNFNEPTLALLMLDDRHRGQVKFSRKSVSTQAGAPGPLVTLAFKETDRPTLIRSVVGQPVYATGEMDIEAGTGRIHRTRLEMSTGSLRATLEARYELDPKLHLLVPSLFTERYEDGRSRERQVIVCEARYTNYRRFEVSVRIKDL